MKNFWSICAILAFFMMLIPIAAGEREGKEQPTVSTYTPVGTDTNADVDVSLPTTEEQDVFRVLLVESQQVVEVPAEEYLCGVLAAEIGPSFAPEAMKAQAVASYTYACALREQQRKKPSSDLKGADISDSTLHQRYYTLQQLQEKWGESFQENYDKIKSAVDQVAGEIIVYDGEPILAAFHAISSGKTESSGKVWNTDVPYLASVNSSGDMLSPSYISTLTLTPTEFESKLKGIGVKSLGKDPAKWVGESETSEAGTVLSIKIGSKKLTGQQMRQAFGLRSSAFTVQYDGSQFNFTVHGFGHFVGMSQYGAEYMAQMGSTYQEILKHYYTGVEIVQTKQSAEPTTQPITETPPEETVATDPAAQ